MGHIGLFLGFSVAFLGFIFMILPIFATLNDRTQLGTTGVGMLLIAAGFFVGRSGLDMTGTPISQSGTAFIILAILGGLFLLIASLTPSRNRKKNRVN